MAAIYGYSDAALNRRHGAVREIHGDEVTGNYFDLLGVRPQLGRFFHAADVHGPNSAPYLVLSDALWHAAFDADPGVLGKTVELNRHPFTVIGVTPAAFHGIERFKWPNYWIPMANEEQVEGWDYLHSRTSPVTVIGRLKPGVSARQAAENLDAISTELAREYPETDKGLPVRLIHPGLLGDEGEAIRGFLYSVTVLTLLVLVAACTNLASLFAARTSDRSRELALRVALGSSRRRLMRQLLTEAVTVSLVGGAAGMVGANLLLEALNRWHPSFGHLAVSANAPVYLVAVMLTLGTALLFGMAPARQAWRSSPLQMMKHGPTVGGPLRRLAPRDLLLGGQIAICALLVTASLVAVRGMVRTLHAPLGFKPNGAMLVQISQSQAGLPRDAVPGKERAILEAVQNLPGVTAAGVVNVTPMNGWIRGVPIYRPGAVEFMATDNVMATFVYAMSPGYLAAADTRLLSGRDVSWRDTARTPPVAIVNETFARRMWGPTPAVGRHFIIWGHLTKVVGVVENGRYHDLEEPPQPAVYLPLTQKVFGDVVLVVRSGRTPHDLSAVLSRTLSGFIPNASISVRSWSEALAGVWFPARAAAGTLGAMGLLAAMLAVTGIFGMAAYSVSRRRKELGIRMALGARGPQVMCAAIGRPIMLLGVGSVAGLTSGVCAGRLLRQIVYQADPGNPLVLIGAVLAMGVLGIAACAIPAMRARAIDPAMLIREE